MEFLNVLAQQITIFNDLPNVELNWLTNTVKIIIEKLSFGGSIAVGILLFSLILKIIPLPFDIYSRVSTKKNAIRMEKMRPELEKLQKQYANNKELYQKKMMALYKKEGYSTFATCLPTIFTLVFFIVVITAFNQYSSWAKIEVFNNMARSYSQEIIQNDDYVERRYHDVYLEDADGHKKGELNLESYVSSDVNSPKYDAGFDWTLIDGVLNRITVVGAEFTEEEQEIIRRVKFYEKESATEEQITSLYNGAKDAAARTYLEQTEKFSFLWVKNIWIEDLPWKKAFIDSKTYNEKLFVYSGGCKSKKLESPIKSEEAYEKIMTSELPEFKELKDKPNGYLILVIISIGTMLLQQIITNKQQKTQMELQSVDGANGQAAQTSKMMMWMMPIMFGFFSFMYTASFSLYLIVSTVFSMISTILINKIVEKKVQKQVEKVAEEDYQKRYGHLLKDKDSENIDK